MILGVVMTLVGCLLYLYTRKLDEPFEEYEFQNRTDGGVVEFESLAISKAHYRKRRYISYLGALGMLVAVIGIFEILSKITP